MQNVFGNDILVQGYFFQRQDRLGVRAAPGDGNVAVVVNQMIGTMFAGGLSRNSDGTWAGWLNELGEGQSLLTQIYLDQDTLSFIKRYENDHDGCRIEYALRLHVDYWVGTWTGSDNRGSYGNGKAVCVLTPVPPAFFEPL